MLPFSASLPGHLERSADRGDSAVYVGDCASSDVTGSVAAQSCMVVSEIGSGLLTASCGCPVNWSSAKSGESRGAASACCCSGDGLALAGPAGTNGGVGPSAMAALAHRRSPPLAPWLRQRCRGGRVNGFIDTGRSLIGSGSMPQNRAGTLRGSRSYGGPGLPQVKAHTHAADLHPAGVLNAHPESCTPTGGRLSPRGRLRSPIARPSSMASRRSGAGPRCSAAREAAGGGSGGKRRHHPARTRCGALWCAGGAVRSLLCGYKFRCVCA